MSIWKAETARDLSSEIHQKCPQVSEALEAAAAVGVGGPLGSAIAIDNLSLVFQTGDGPVHALSDIDLNIDRGDFVSFIGPSGCGKTTLLRVIADLEQATGGNITVNGMSPEQARLQRAYGYVFQAASLYPWRTIARKRRSAVGDHGIVQKRTSCSSGEES